MIIKMHKYTFWVYHKEYEDFLSPLQELGIVHVVEKDKSENHQVEHKHKILNKINQTLKFLNHREIEPGKINETLNAEALVKEVAAKQNELQKCELDLVEAKKSLKRAELWGDFSVDTIEKLENEGFFLKFFVASKKRFDPKELAEHDFEVIAETSTQVYFVIVVRENASPAIDAEETKLPEKPLSEINADIVELETKIATINTDFDKYAATAIPALEKEYNEVKASLEFEKTIQQTESHSDEKIKLLQGWVPDNKKNNIDSFLDKNSIVYLVENATKEDSIPVLIKNNRFSKLFEPIGKLFALPSYSELDLTIFFAPFFMLFFGFCLGDAGYGLIFIIGAAIYKLKADKEIKPILSLLQWLGLATVLFGVITGTFFGINLIETEVGFLENYRQFFLDSDKMFNLALILGAFQIVFAMFIRAANQARQFGFTHALSTIGWLIIILGSGIYMGLTKAGIIPEISTILYAIMGLGGFFVIFFSDVNANVFSRIGIGVWDIYSTVTGIFGDILSYIRLFALGLSSAILGFVINDIGMQILGSSKILGPVFFVVFLLLGHTLNILIASLGSFVHPMRLTFVEFYKNAGFKGGGKEYKPFSK